MKAGKFVLVCALAVLTLFTGLAPTAYAFGKHGPKAPHVKVRKNTGTFGGKYMAPKKQHRPSGYYRSTLTGKMVYGKQKR